MTNVIAFRRPAERHVNAHQMTGHPMRGATLFLHIKQTSLIAHLAKPLGQRAVRAEKTGRSKG